MPEPNPQAVPDNSGKPSPTAGSGATDPSKGVTAEEHSKQIAELQTKLKEAEGKATHWSQVAGQASGELGQLRQSKEKFAPYEAEIEERISRQNRKSALDQKIENVRTNLGDEQAGAVLDLMDSIRQEDQRLMQSQLTALNEKLLLLEKPDLQKLKPLVEELKKEIQTNPNLAQEALYLAAIGKNFDKLLAEKKVQWDAEKEEQLKKMGSANQTGGLTGIPQLSPEEEDDIRKTKDEILAVSKPVNPIFGL